MATLEIDTPLEIDEIQQGGVRKIQLTHLVHRLIQEGTLPPLQGKSCLNIGPSSSGIDGYVLRQFGVTHIDAIESHEPFVEQLHSLVACVARHDSRYDHPFYSRVVHDDVHHALNHFKSHSYDLLVGFNVYGKSMQWELLSNVFFGLLSPQGTVLLTMPKLDLPSISLGSAFSERSFDFTSYLSQRPMPTVESTPGLIRDQLGFSLPHNFSYNTTYDQVVFVATKLPKV